MVLAAFVWCRPLFTPDLLHQLACFIFPYRLAHGQEHPLDHLTWFFPVGQHQVIALQVHRPER